MLRCVITRPDIYVINSHTAITGAQCKGLKVSIFSALRGLKQGQVGPLTPPLLVNVRGIPTGTFLAVTRYPWVYP